MHVLIELWKSNDAWRKLSVAAREEYMAQVGPGNAQLAAQGITVIAWGKNDAETDHRADYDYFAVWSMPSEAGARTFEDAIRSIGWYDYMDQVNLSGVATDPVDVAAMQVREAD